MTNEPEIIQRGEDGRLYAERPDFERWRTAIVQADWERSDQALWLATSELGPEPEQCDYFAWVDYVARVNTLAYEIMARAI